MPQNYPDNRQQQAKILRFIINNSGGYIRDEATASYVLIGAVLLIVIFSAWNIINALKGAPPERSPDYAQHESLLKKEQSVKQH